MSLIQPALLLAAGNKGVILAILAFCFRCGEDACCMCKSIPFLISNRMCVLILLSSGFAFCFLRLESTLIGLVSRSLGFLLHSAQLRGTGGHLTWPRKFLSLYVSCVRPGHFYTPYLKPTYKLFVPWISVSHEEVSDVKRRKEGVVRR